jgi:putative FmdB family regulatory protein
VATYSYRCTACGHRFDAVQRMVEDPLTECPSCGGFVKRTIQSVPIVFKGSGWYKTDSRKPAESTTTDATASKKAEGEKASEKAKSATTESVAAAAD